MTDLEIMAIMRRPLILGKLPPGMVRKPGHAVGTRWLYQGTHWRSLGNARLEEYEVVQGCVVERVSYSANFPDVPVHLVTLDNGCLANANLVALTAYLGPAFSEGDIRLPFQQATDAHEAKSPERATVAA